MRNRTSLYWLWNLSQGIRKSLFCTVLAGVLRVLCNLGFIYISKEMIDGAIRNSYDDLMGEGLCLVLLMLLGICLNSLMGWMSTVMETEVANRLRKRLFMSCLNGRQWGEKNYHSGDIQSRLVTDVRIVAGQLSVTTPQLIVGSIQLLASLLFLKRLDGSLSLVAVVCVCMILFSGRIYTKRMRKHTHQVRTAESAIHSMTQECILRSTVIKTLEQSGIMGMRLFSLQKELYDIVKRRVRFSVASRSVLSLGFSSTYVLTFLWCVSQLQQGIISFGVMTAFLQLVGQIQRPIADLAKFVPSFVISLASVERLIELESVKQEESGSPVLLTGVAGVRLGEVCFSYGNRPVLGGLTYDFAPGSVTAVLGKTGAGKTTLIRLLLSLISPQGGCIDLYNSEVEVPVSVSTRCNFVYVPQGNSLFSGSIRENLLMGNPSANEQELREALYDAAAEFVYQLPHGLDTHCEEQGGGLSEGQAQRIAIARSLLRPGSILLLDEATSALDASTEALLLSRLRKYIRKKTIILITHNEEITSIGETLILAAMQS